MGVFSWLLVCCEGRGEGAGSELLVLFFMWTSEVALQHYFCVDIMAPRLAQKSETSRVEKANVLPFRYQFAAGAVAGISEVESSSWFGIMFADII